MNFRMLESTVGRIGAAISFLAGLLFFATQGMILFHVGGMQSSIGRYNNPKDPFRGKDITVLNYKLDGSRRFKPGYEALGKFDDIDADRQVHFTAIVPIRTLLEPGEDAPERGMEEVFAQARAIRYAHQECERLTKTIASECEPQYADARIDDGKAHITATLKFVQRAPLGDLEKGATYSFQSVDTAVFKTSRKVATISATDERLRIYREADRQCAEIKRREGNCAIHSVVISAYDGGDGAGQSIMSHATYAFLALQRKEQTQ
jgi:hypothetical protein